MSLLQPPFIMKATEDLSKMLGDYDIVPVLSLKMLLGNALYLFMWRTKSGQWGFHRKLNMNW